MMWLFFLGLMVLETWGDVFAKRYGLAPHLYYFVMALLLYFIANASWLISMQYGMKLWQGVVLYGISQAITGIVVGLYMGESINVHQWIGIVIGMIAILLILQD